MRDKYRTLDFKKLNSNGKLLFSLFIALILALLSRLKVFSPIQIKIYTLVNLGSNVSFNNLYTLTKSKFELEGEIRSLKEESIQLHSQLFKQSYELSKYEQYKDQTNFNSFKTFRTSVINSLPLQENDVLISGGTDSGFRKDMPVIYENFLIGRLKEVSKNSSILELITTEANSIPAITIGKNTRGLIVQSDKSDYDFELREVFIRDRLKLDDVIVTLGKDSIYPSGLIIGVVRSIDEIQSDVTKKVYVKSFIEFDNLTDVYVVTGY